MNKAATINFEKTSKKYVDISLLVDGKELKRTKRKLKYRAGKFFLKKESYFETAHLVFFRFGGKQFYLRLNENNNLAVTIKSSNTALFILLPVGGTGYAKDYEFEKVEN